MDKHFVKSLLHALHHRGAFDTGADEKLDSTRTPEYKQPSDLKEFSIH